MSSSMKGLCRRFSFLPYFLLFLVWVSPLFLVEPAVRADAIDWPTLGFSQVGTNTFSTPVIITHAGDGSGRMFIGEQAGRIQILQGTNKLAQPFLDLANRIMSVGPEQGLLGLAFPPGFPAKQYFYLDYTRPPDGAVVISRFNVSSTNANVADTNSEQIILVIPKPYNNHNGGQLAFGPDGYLYIGVGDGGSEGDPLNYGQNTGTLLGKLLRIDVESGVSPYAVPTNNPFVNNTNYAPEIWAFGLRNPWRFSFDRQTGGFYIGDVGGGYYEEVDFQPASSSGGQNYGWSIMEGPTNLIVPNGFTNFSALTVPVASYSHIMLPSDGSAAVIGGYVYRGPDAPRLNGLYFYGDYAAGWIWGLKQSGTNWQNLVLANQSFRMSTFGEDDPGQIYLADYFGGRIYQIYDSRQTLTPSFSSVSGIVNSNLLVVSCLTTGADIHYTSNNLDPVQSDPVVAAGGTILVTNGLTYKLRAFRFDLTPSLVATGRFVLQAGAPYYTPPAGPITNGTLVSLATVTSNTVVYYTTNQTTPTLGSTVYSTPLLLSGGASVEAFAVAAGYSNSVVTQAGYSSAQTATPVFTPSSGGITDGTPIAISCSTPGSVIYYTTNGSAPTASSTVYSVPVVINANTTLQAFATTGAYLDSNVRSVLFTLAPAALPAFNPAFGPITNGTLMVISCFTPGATIRYTVDNTTPSNTSPVYSGPFALNGGTVLKAYASAPGYLDGPVQSIYFGLFDYRYSTVVTTVAGSGQAGASNAVGAFATFDAPSGICLDAAGNLYVADTLNNMIRKIQPDGTVTTLAGGFSSPIGICVDLAGNVYVADSGDYQIRKVDPLGNVSVFSGTGEAGLTDGSSGIAMFRSLTFLKIDSRTNFFLGDADYWGDICFRTIAPDGTVATLAGTAYFQPDIGVAVDSSDNVYAASGYGLVLKLPFSGAWTLFAGTRNIGYNDGPPLAARFAYDSSWHGRDIAVDATGNIYVADTTRVRKIDTTGWVSTLAGFVNPGSLNGNGRSARFSGVAGLCVDTNGNVYVADTTNNLIRKISPDTAGIGIADDWQIALSVMSVSIPMPILTTMA